MLNRSTAHLFAVLLFLSVFAWSNTAGNAGEFTIGARRLRVPEGFTVERVAGPPQIERPISISRDEQGRLYVTDSAGLNDKGDKQQVAKPHRIRQLQSSRGDGHYDQSTLFAEHLMFPEGCQWYEGALYVAAPPEIWKFTDAKNCGTAEQREVWFDGKTLTGCANDLHGPYLGPDGRIYWCKGAFAEQRYTLHGGKPFVTRASHIFRSLPDGRETEPVLTGGMDNPVGVAFLSSGERILSCTFFQFPAGGRRDGLIHAIYGGVYGKKHDSIEEHRQTGDVMPVLSHQGAAAPCGIVAGSAAALGGGYQDHLFACYFNLHKVVHHLLIPHGATFDVVDEDFLACDNPDFHPTDVLEDADGSILVADTGGWYKMCCPTSQLAKPDVLGAIYRVYKTDAKPVDDPLGEKLDWKAPSPQILTERLADIRLFVQRRATAALRRLGQSAIAPLQAAIQKHPRAEVRQRAVWALAGIEDESARAAIRRAVTDTDHVVRMDALHSAGLWRDAAALDNLLDAMHATDPAEVRAAAEALGRLEDAKATPALIAAIRRMPQYTPDESGAPADADLRIREHSLIYALLEIGDAAGIKAALAKENQSSAGNDQSSLAVRRALLVALDQLGGDNLLPDDTLPLLDAPQSILKNTASWIVSHRPQWGAKLTAYLTRRLHDPPTAKSDREALVQQLAKLTKSADIQAFLAAEWTQTAVADPANAEQQAVHDALVLAAMSQAGLAKTPPAWFDGMARRLPTLQPPLLNVALLAVRQWPLPKGGHADLKAALLAVSRRGELPRGARLDALAASGPVDRLDADLFQLLADGLQAEDSPADRSVAAQTLGTARLSADQQAALLAIVPRTGPLELVKLLPAWQRADSEAHGLQLISALRSSPGLKSLRGEQIRITLAKWPAGVREAAEKLIAEVDVSAAQQAAHLDLLIGQMQPGNVGRGHEIFISKKANCINCHSLGYQGGKLGPDLTNIGKVRTERDLLESIVYPSASFVRGFEPMLVELSDGRVLTGIIARENRDEITLALDPQKSQTISRQDIAGIQPGKVSLMPQGMDKVLTLDEMADVIAFLKSDRH